MAIAPFAALLLLGAARAEPPVADPLCRNDRDPARCAQERLRRSLEAYRVQSIESHREAGDQVYRVFYYDTHGDDIILLAFIRAAGRDPAVRVHYPSSRRGAVAETIEAPATQRAWDELVRRAEHFDESFALEPGEDPELRYVCTDGASSRIESVGRARGRLPAEIRLDVAGPCGDDPGSVFAEEAARLALPLFAPCAVLGPDFEASELLRLRDCRMLRGDRLAAAEVLNFAEGFRFFGGPEDAHRIAGRFAQETAIDWNGVLYRGAGHRADEFWIERLGGEGARLGIERVEGESADRVRLTGWLQRSADTPRGRNAGFEHARVEQLWVRDFNGDIRLANTIIGPWESQVAD